MHSTIVQWNVRKELAELVNTANTLMDKLDEFREDDIGELRILVDRAVAVNAKLIIRKSNDSVSRRSE